MIPLKDGERSRRIEGDYVKDRSGHESSLWEGKRCEAEERKVRRQRGRMGGYSHMSIESASSGIGRSLGGWKGFGFVRPAMENLVSPCIVGSKSLD